LGLILEKALIEWTCLGRCRSFVQSLPLELLGLDPYFTLITSTYNEEKETRACRILHSEGLRSFHQTIITGTLNERNETDE